MSFSEKLEQLKGILCKTEDLSESSRFFLDNFGNNPDFMQHGKSVKHDRIKSIMKATCADLFGKQSKVTTLNIFSFKKENFHHGLCHMDGRLAVFFYFDEIEMGLITIMMGPVFGQCSYVRFSATTVDSSRVGRLVAPSKMTIQ